MTTLPHRKMCNVCTLPLSVDAFSKNARFTDGLDRTCRSCLGLRRRAAYKRRLDTETPEERTQRRAAATQRTKSYYTPEKGKAADKRMRARETPIEREIRLARMREWREERLDEQRARSRAYHAEHREELHIKAREYDRTHRVSLTAQQRKWRQANPANKRASEQNRRARKRGNGGNFTPEEWEALCVKYDHHCLACGKQKPLTVDHVVPLILGGRNDISNIQPLCLSCNAAKGGRTIDYR